ncbi:MAG: dodecin family protein [Thermoplasmata archaeon]
MPLLSVPTLVDPMVQKVSEVVGVSSEGFAKAAENAIATAGRSVRNIKWFRATEFEGIVEQQKVTSYRVTVRIYFDLEGA